MEKKILTEKDFNVLFGKVEDVKVMLWHMGSLAELLVIKYQSLVDAGTLKDDKYAVPILSIAEMMTEKTEAALKNLEEIDEVGKNILNAPAA